MDWILGGVSWAEFAAGFAAIMLLNFVLSGDNAVLIALASRNLPAKQRTWAMFWGSFGAVFLRVILTVIAAQLLVIPFLKFVGGLLILWIAVKLLCDEGGGEETKAGSNLIEAIKVIIFADLIMSTDNVLAIAGICVKDNHVMWSLLIIGLLTSIPIIVLGAQLVVVLMSRFPIIIYLGAGILGWTGGEMIISDRRIEPLLEHSLSPRAFAIMEYAVPVILTIGVLVAGYLLNERAKRKEAYEQEAKEA